MVAEIFLGWAVGEVLSGALGLTKRGLTKNEQQEIRARTVERLSADLPPVLAKAIGDQLSAEVRSGGDLSVALSEQLSPLLRGWFEDRLGVRETGEQLLARLGFTFAQLVERTEQAIVAAAHDVAGQQGGLPFWSTHQKLDRIIEQSSPRVTDTLMAAPEHMVGRRRELDELARQVRTVVIHGMGGVGKTALVRAFAAEVSGRFPDGRFEVNLHGFSPGCEPRSPDLVLAELLRQVGFPPADIPTEPAAKSERWRAWLADRAVLLILDNARAAEDVRSLLPGGAPRCLVLVTSRNRLDDLDPSFRLAVDTLPEPDAVVLLRELSGRDEDYAEIARHCGYLPLALRVVGPLLARISARDLAASMGHVDELDQKVRAAFTASYEDLNPELQRLLRWCSLHPGPDFDAGSAAAIWDLPEPVAAIRLDDFAKRNLLHTVVERRYAFHDLFRTYARELAIAHDEAEAASIGDRLHTSLSQRVAAALHGGSTEWLETATSELEAAVTGALTAGRDEAGRLASAVAWWLYLSGWLPRARRIYRLWLEVAEQSDNRFDQARAWWGSARIAWVGGDLGEAREGFRRALALWEEAGDRDGQGRAWWGLAQVALALGELGEGDEGFRRAHAFSAGTGNLTGQIGALLGLAQVALARGDLDEAGEEYRQALTVSDNAQNRGGRADAWWGLAQVALARGRSDEAGEAYRRTLVLYEETGNRHGQATAHYELGALAATAADTEAACHAFRAARDIFADIGDRYRVEGCTEALERLECE